MSTTSPSLGAGPSGEAAWGRSTLGRFRLCSELGRGGMGVVYLAVDERGRAVAVKLLRDHVADDPAARARLAREVDHLSRIRHPGVAGIVAADVTGRRPYVVTRYIPGPSLDRYVAQHGPLAPAELLSLARDLSDALTAVHAVGVVHRDLKPANVLLHDGRPVLIDFGIAHAADDPRITSSGLVMGTPGFLAPEILDGARVTPATDWWAWASTLAFAASGRVPFGDGPVSAVLARIRAGECDLGGVDPRLAPLLRAALDPRPEARPTQDRILAELERYAAGGVAPTESLPAVPATEVIPKVAPTAPVTAVPPPAAERPPYGAAPATRGPFSPRPTAMPVGRRGPGDGARPVSAGGPPEGLGPAYPPAGAPYRPQATGGTGVAGGAAPAAPYRSPGRRTGVVLAGAALLAAVALVAPVAAFLLGVCWSWFARTVERAVVGLSLRRGEYGVRRGDVVGAVLRSPVYALGAALASVLGAVLPAFAGWAATAGAIALQGGGAVPGASADPSAPAPLLTGAVAALIVGWWGPGGSAVRRGTRVVARAASPGRHGAGIVAGVLLLGAAVVALVSQSSGFEPSWLPLSSDPFGWLRGLPAGF